MLIVSQSAAVSFLESVDLSLFGVPPQLAEWYSPRIESVDEHAEEIAPSRDMPAAETIAPDKPGGEDKEEVAKAETGPHLEPMERDLGSKPSSWASSLLGRRQ